MALNKSTLNINFSNTLNTKIDPFQLPIGQFLSLSNCIFNNDGLLQKRNGFGPITSLPNSNSVALTTFNGGLTAVGTSLEAYSAGSNMWVNKGALQPVRLDVLPLIRSNTNQSSVDHAIASNGLICTVFTDQNPSNLSASIYKYAIADSATGQNIVAPTLIPVTSGAITNSPRVFVLGRYFIIMFTNVISATPHLQYVAISIANPTTVTANADISAQYTPSTRLNFDAVVANDTLFVAWNGSDGGGAIRVASISSTLVQSTTKVFAGRVATIMSVTADNSGSTPVIYASFYNSGSSTGYTLAVSQSLVTILAPTQIIASGTVLNITSTAASGICHFFYEIDNAYSYGSQKTNYIKKNTITVSGTVGSATVMVRSVGLASKAFLYNNVSYMATIYNSAYQPTYFFVNDSGQMISKIAYSNGPANYYAVGLPSTQLIDNTVSFGYLIKDQIQAVNKVQGATSTTGVYSQLGINLASILLTTSKISTIEVGQNLNISGGYITAYDGYTPAEQGFNLWPDNIDGTWSTTNGNMVAKPDGTTNTNAYFYQVTYEWADNQGNMFRSAPSIPLAITTSGSGNTGSVTLNIPTLRLTYKLNNPVKLVIYRWSVGQQIYYQTTSIQSPILNDPSVDSILYVDTNPDSAIIGNNILYTTGGVIENIAPPATDIMTMYQSRLFLVDSEDRNLLWFSKQVIEATPVEMSDLFTIYVAPTLGSQGSTGPITSLAAMDDKLIIGKENAFYYITGAGPDNTGVNNQYSEPTFITATVGCANQQSFVMIPNGLMFQSDKGIWLLGRDLSTQYIGAPVEAYNAYTVLSAISVPGTNQVRFTMSNGTTLMYDYYYNRWATFDNIPAISSTLYQGLHTYISSSGSAFQETPGLYLDDNSPVLLSFQTGWLNLAGVQGYERFYQMYLLGKYITPFKLNIQLAYDYQQSNSQSVIVTPNNFSPAWGGEQLWGSSEAWGGTGLVFEARLFPEIQKCESFQISVNELYDPSYGVAAGAGLTLSGINAIVGLKKGYRTSSASRSFG